jgi:hypothetical protein
MLKKIKNYQTMKKLLLLKLTALSMTILLLSACKKDYITGGVPEDINVYKNTFTYDVLKTDPTYDTLVQIIDAAGLKDKINEQGTTFFVPSDNAIFSYLNLRSIYVQEHYNVNKKFALDSLIYYLQNNVAGTKDSLLMYLIHQQLPYSVLTDEGALYQTALGDTAVVSFEYTKSTNLGYNSIVSSSPQVEYFTPLWQPYTITPSTPAGDIPEKVGTRNLCKTSGINTKNGIMNALDNSHALFFYDVKK